MCKLSYIFITTKENDCVVIVESRCWNINEGATDGIAFWRRQSIRSPIFFFFFSTSFLPNSIHIHQSTQTCGYFISSPCLWPWAWWFSPYDTSPDLTYLVTYSSPSLTHGFVLSPSSSSSPLTFGLWVSSNQS